MRPLKQLAHTLRIADAMHKRNKHTAAWLTAAGAVGLMYGMRTAVRHQRRMSFTRKTVLITGGSRGLGLALARGFASEGANVAICARNESNLARARADLRRSGIDVLGVQCDVTSPEQVNGMIDGLTRHFGGIDVLVNNAGTIVVGPMETMSIEDYQEAMRTHFWGPLHTTFAVLPQMKARQAGRIVNISSIGGKISVPHLLPYSASKFALTGFSEGLRAELAQHNLYVTTVCPGLMRTGSARNALFKGKHREEYTWFAVSDSLPAASISATAAARTIIRACRYGQAETTVSIPARLATTFHALFPGLTAELHSWINQALPESGGIGTNRALGRDSETDLTRSSLTALSQAAAKANNEVG